MLLEQKASAQILRGPRRGADRGRPVEERRDIFGSADALPTLRSHDIRSERNGAGKSWPSNCQVIQEATLNEIPDRTSLVRSPEPPRLRKHHVDRRTAPRQKRRQ